ncbi:MAG: hypothetical protein U9Q71_09315 [Pseudomonadota bacterium]|nr:hypothetical protein [Pseudomonadota bacterium]
MKTRHSLALLISLPLFAGSAMADATLEFRLGKEGKKLELLIQDDKLLIPDVGDGSSLLFIRDEKGIIFLDNQYREFTAVNEEWMQDYAKKMTEMAKDMEKRMQEQLKNMPPEQRKLYQQGQLGMKLMPMLGGFMGGGGSGLSGGLGGLVSSLLSGSKGPRSYIPTTRKYTVAGMVCSQVDVFQSGSKVENLCVAQPTDLNMTAGESQTIGEFSRVAASMSKSGIGMMGFEAPGLVQIGIQGVPLWVKKTGAETPDLQLLSASSEPIDPDRFMIPANYMETQLPVLGM